MNHNNNDYRNYPKSDATVYSTAKGTSYLKEAGVVITGTTAPNFNGMEEFLSGFDENLGFADYLNDPEPVPPLEAICKTAGQLCYMSFGPKRTKNADADRYFDNLIRSGHGSVLEHANITMLCYGISRSLTHELVRHRAGFAYSQVSQRYVSGKVLRFVERPEFQADKGLHAEFEARIDRTASEYETIAKRLIKRQSKGTAILSGEKKTDLRKRVQQCARSVLTNETEAPIFVTGNLRAWRHFLAMRASEHAEIEIRALAFKTFLCLKEIAPIIFGDFETINLSDGTKAIKTPYPKV